MLFNGRNAFILRFVQVPSLQASDHLIGDVKFLKNNNCASKQGSLYPFHIQKTYFQKMLSKLLLSAVDQVLQVDIV